MISTTFLQFDPLLEFNENYHPEPDRYCSITFELRCKNTLLDIPLSSRLEKDVFECNVTKHTPLNLGKGSPNIKFSQSYTKEVLNCSEQNNGRPGMIVSHDFSGLLNIYSFNPSLEIY